MTIVNDATSWSIILEPSIMLLELTIALLESSVMLLDNIYSTGITHDDHHVMIVTMFIVQATEVIWC